MTYTQKNRRDIARQIVSYTAAMPYLMKNHLRGSDNTSEVQHLIESSIYEELQQIEHKPNFISAKIATLLNELVVLGALKEFPFLRLEACREMVVDCQGASERILKTPMPFVMAVKSRRFILLFLLMLPFALVDYSIYLNPLITALVSYALFSLDQIGVELQNPFSREKLSHLPLNDICKTIERDLLEICCYEDSN